MPKRKRGFGLGASATPTVSLRHIKFRTKQTQHEDERNSRAPLLMADNDNPLPRNFNANRSCWSKGYNSEAER